MVSSHYGRNIVGSIIFVMFLAQCGMPPEVKKDFYDRQFDDLPASTHIEAAAVEAIAPYNFPAEDFEETQAVGDALRDK